MRNRAFLKVVLLGLLTFALVPGVAGAASQGQNSLAEIELSSHAAMRANAFSAVIEVTPTALHFGTVNVGDSPTMAYSIRNMGLTGAANLDLTGTAVMFAGVPIEIVSLSLTSLPPFVDGGGTSTLTVRFTPAASGFVSQEIRFFSNAENDVAGAYFVTADGDGNTAPAIVCPADATFNAFVVNCIDVDANDSEGDGLTFSYTINPPPAGAGPTFNDATGEFCWTPDGIDVGSYTVAFCVEDEHGAGPSCCTINLDVQSNNRPPVANPAGPYSGTAGAPVFFDGSGSSDPDAGQVLAYFWDLGDGSTSTDQNPVHVYAASGTYPVSLTVTDNGSPQFSNSAATAAIIGGSISAQAILKLTGGALKTFGGSLQAAGLEPNTISATTINPASIRMSTDAVGAGIVGEIAPSGKAPVIGDLDNDGLGDLDVTFTRADLNNLLGLLPNNSVVTIFLTAQTFGGATVVGQVGGVKVKTHGSSLVSALAAPNPFNPETSISYTLRNSGTVTVRIFGLNGQLVRTLKNEYGTPGTHEVRWDGRDDRGSSVNSGLYFLKVEQGAEFSISKLSLLK